MPAQWKPVKFRQGVQMFKGLGQNYWVGDINPTQRLSLGKSSLTVLIRPVKYINHASEIWLSFSVCATVAFFDKAAEIDRTSVCLCSS